MHPILIHTDWLDIHTYGVFVAAGFLAGLWVGARRATGVGLKPENIYDIGVWLIVAGMAGGKLFHILFFWRDFLDGLHQTGLRSLREGFVFYGGFIGASAATFVYARSRRLSLWKLADLLAPSVALGHAFGRLGCFFNGCCYGGACNLPWAVRYPEPHYTHGAAVHPTQLYEVLGNLAIFAGLSVVLARPHRDGQVWWLYVLSYGAVRLGVECFRGDYEVRYLGSFSIGQLVAITMIVIAAVALALIPKETKP